MIYCITYLSVLYFIRVSIWGLLCLLLQQHWREVSMWYTSWSHKRSTIHQWELFCMIQYNANILKNIIQFKPSATGFPDWVSIIICGIVATIYTSIVRIHFVWIQFVFKIWTISIYYFFIINLGYLFLLNILFCCVPGRYEGRSLGRCHTVYRLHWRNYCNTRNSKCRIILVNYLLCSFNL